MLRVIHKGQEFKEDTEGWIKSVLFLSLKLHQVFGDVPRSSGTFRGPEHNGDRRGVNDPRWSDRKRVTEETRREDSKSVGTDELSTTPNHQ